MEELVASSMEMDEEEGIPLPERTSDFVDQGFIATRDGLVAGLEGW
jgi:hypothetical protein